MYILALFISGTWGRAAYRQITWWAHGKVGLWSLGEGSVQTDYLVGPQQGRSLGEGSIQTDYLVGPQQARSLVSGGGQRTDRLLGGPTAC